MEQGPHNWDDKKPVPAAFTEPLSYADAVGYPAMPGLDSNAIESMLMLSW